LGIPNENGIRMAVEDYGQIGGHDVDLGTGMDDLCVLLMVVRLRLRPLSLTRM